MCSRSVFTHSAPPPSRPAPSIPFIRNGHPRKAGTTLRKPASPIPEPHPLPPASPGRLHPLPPTSPGRLRQVRKRIRGRGRVEGRGTPGRVGDWVAELAEGSGVVSRNSRKGRGSRNSRKSLNRQGFMTMAGGEVGSRFKFSPTHTPRASPTHLYPMTVPTNLPAPPQPTRTPSVTLQPSTTQRLLQVCPPHSACKGGSDILEWRCDADGSLQGGGERGVLRAE